MLRHPRDVPTPGGKRLGSSIHSVAEDAARARLEQAENDGRERALAAAARAHEHHRLARQELEVDAIEHSPRPRRIAVRDPLEPDDGAVRGVAGAPSSLRRATSVGLGQLEQALTDGEAVCARVVLRRDRAQREIQLGSEQQDRQAGLESDVPVDEPNADRHGDECDAERGSQLEYRPREERDPERLHRRPPIVVAGRGERLGLRAAAVVGAKRRQPAHDVEKPRREQCERLRSRSRLPIRVTPDQHHEHRHERQRQRASRAPT